MKTQLLFLIIIFLFFISSSFSQNSTSISSIDSITALLKTDKEDTNKVRHLNDLGWKLMYINPDTSILLNKQALELATIIEQRTLISKSPAIQMSAKKGIARSNSYLGACYFLKGEYAIALEYHFKSLKLNEELGSKYGISGNLNNIGLIYYGQGDYSRALDYYFKALKLNE